MWEAPTGNTNYILHVIALSRYIEQLPMQCKELSVQFMESSVKCKSCKYNPKSYVRNTIQGVVTKMPGVFGIVWAVIMQCKNSQCIIRSFQKNEKSCQYNVKVCWVVLGVVTTMSGVVSTIQEVVVAM